MPHHFDPTILREYDIRGIVGQTLAVEDALALGRAFGTMVRRARGERVMLGYDGRLSSRELAASVSDGLVSTGCEVLAIGRGPTPMLYYSVYELNADAGIMVTGSHNPPDYNGFKMMLKSGPVYGEAIADLGRIAAEGAYAHGSGKAGRVDIFERYVDRLMQNFSGAALDVAWDPGNGAAGEVTEALAQRLPGRHLVINGAIDGSFPNHHPDPTVEANLAQLKEVVRTQNLDLGIAFDGDGDRIGAVDSQGRVVWGDQLLAILARDVIAQLPGATIIADVKASQVLFDEIEKAGGTPLMWKTGHSLIKSKMAEVGSPLAGEMSGHIFFKHDYYGFDDALYAAVRLIASVSHQGGDLAALRDALPDAVNTPEMRFDCPEERKRAVVAEVRARLEQDGAEVNAIDGVRVTTQDGWWLLRPSNTQAVLVARCEAKDQAGLDRLMALLRDQLDRSGIALPAA